MGLVGIDVGIIRLQASCGLPGAIARASDLLPDDCWNPNTIRAVVGGFVRGDPKGFHAKSGAGYAWLRAVILRVDERNPQMGAALSKLLLDYADYDEQRAGLMREELQCILESKGISKDTQEVASRALGVSML